MATDYNNQVGTYSTQTSQAYGKPTYYANGAIADWTQNIRDGDKYYTGEGSGKGWYPIMSNTIKGAEINAQKAGQAVNDQQALLSNPNSKYYTDYYSKLKGVLSSQSSLNSLLGLNRAMGLSMSGSSTIANEQRRATEGRITDYAGQSTKDLFQANLGASNSLLGMGLQNAQYQQGYQLQQQQYQDSKKFDWGGFASTLGQIAGIVAAPFTGGTSLIASGAIATANANMNKNSQSSGYGTGNWRKDSSGNWSYGG